MDWLTILNLCGVRPGTAARWSEVFAAAKLPDKGLPDFLGQVLHESGKLELLSENLNYSAERLRQVWPSRFPTAAHAAACARNPEALAERVYGGRMGNDKPGDGYRYRGRGLMQVTGRNNYAQVGRDIGVDLLADPDQLTEPAIALAASVAWWERNIPAAILGDVVAVTKRVNGGTAGLEDRRELTAKAREALGQRAAA